MTNFNFADFPICYDVKKALGKDFAEKGEHIIAFKPNQIKSAIGNNGEYSEDDSILKKVVGENTSRDFHDIKFAPVPDLIEKSKIERTGDRIKVNLEGQEFLRRVLEESDIRAAEKNSAAIWPKRHFQGFLPTAPTQTAF